MFETIFGIIGVAFITHFLYSLGEYFIFKSYYRGLQSELEDTYYKVGNSEKEVFSRDDVQDIIGLLHNRQYVKQEYFEKETK